MASGIVMAMDSFVAIPLGIGLAALAAFLLSIVAFGVMTYRDARSSGLTYAAALGQGLRAAGKALWVLMP